MTSLLLSAVLSQTSSKAMFDQCLAAHKALGKASITVTSEARAGKQLLTGRFDVAYERPTNLRLRIRQDGSDRIFYVLGQRFLGYDPKTSEYLERSAPAGLTLLERAVLMLQTVDDSVQAVIEPTSMSGFFARFAQLRNWRIERPAGHIILSRREATGPRSAMTTFMFNSRTSLLEEFKVSSGAGSLRWRFAYAPATKIAFVPPKGALKVRSFLAPDPSIRFESAKAKSVFERAGRAHDGLRSVEFVVNTGASTSRVWRSGEAVRERQSAIDWSYRAGILTISDLRNGRLYRGTAPFDSVPIFLQRLRSRMDPAVGQFFTRKNAVRVLAGPGSRVKWIGTIVDRGIPCDLVEISDKLLRASAWIGQKDSLLRRVEADNVDEKGNVVTSSKREFRYARIGGIAPTEFDLARGKPVLKLAQIPK